MSQGPLPFPTMFKGEVDLPKCQVCDRINGPLTVVNSALGAFSYAYCKECLDILAEPKDVLLEYLRVTDNPQFLGSIKYWDGKIYQPALGLV